MAKVNGDPELQKALKRVNTANKVRLVFLFLALLIVLFIFYGNKVAEGTAWYAAAKAWSYEVLFITVLLMLLFTILKMVFAAAYNRLVRQKNGK